MGIEQNLERVANALESVAASLKHLTFCADFHVERATLMDNRNNVASPKVRQIAEAAPAETSETPAPAPAAEPEFTYDELKAKLIERGVNIAKGTKMTTLVKLWATYKDAPTAPKEPVEVELVKAEVIEPEAPAADEADLDLFDEEVKAEVTIPVNLDPAKAKEIIQKHYDRSPADCAALKEALSFVGAATFGEIPADQHGVVLARYLELKGIDPKDVEL